MTSISTLVGILMLSLETWQRPLLKELSTSRYTPNHIMNSISTNTSTLGLK